MARSTALPLFDDGPAPEPVRPRECSVSFSGAHVPYAPKDGDGELKCVLCGQVLAAPGDSIERLAPLEKQ